MVSHLLKLNYRVRALVRPGSLAESLSSQGVEIVRGDMLKPETLAPAFEGIDAVITTAAGYTRRKRGDSLDADFQGNRNLIDAAKAAGTRLFVLCSILNCDHEGCRNVPHFKAKAEAEEYLKASGVNYVALRPGAFLLEEYLKSAPTGSYTSFWNPEVKITMIPVEEVARCLVLAVNEPRALNRSIPLGMDRPLSSNELASVLTTLLGRPVKVWAMPSFIMWMASWFSAFMKDIREMVLYFNTGDYVTDAKEHEELFPPVPTVEDSARAVLVSLKALPAKD